MTEPGSYDGGGQLSRSEFQNLVAEPSCVGHAVGLDGHDLAAWVIPSMTWRGSPRWTPRLERYFVSWNILWEGRRRRSFEEAKGRAETVLARMDRTRGRQEHPSWR